MKRMLSRLFILLFVFSFGSTCVAAITFVNPQPGENIHGLTYRIGTEVDIIASKACIIESLVDELDCSAGDAMICSKLEVIESKIDEILDTIECDEIINLQDILNVGTFVITHEGRYCFVGSDVLLTTTLDCAIEVQADNVVLNFANLSIDGNNLANQFVCFHDNENVSVIGGRISNFTENVFFVDNSTNVTITKSHICDNEVAIYVNDSQKIAIDGLDICNTSSAGIIIINTQDTIIRETLLMNDASITVTLQVAIDISGSNDVLLDDVRVINFHNGMVFESTTNIVCTNCLSKENINGGYIVFGPGAKDIIFSSCTALSNEGTGFRINGCNVTCRDCCAMDNDAGFIFDEDTLAALLDGCYGMANNIGLCIEIDVQNLCVVDSYFHANIEIDIKGTSSSTTFASEKIIQDLLAGSVRIILDQTNFDAGETVTIRVPGVVVITEDIIWTVTHKYAVVIEADDVVIDLGNHVFDGLNLGFGAFCAEGVRNLIIQNGIINNFNGGGDIIKALLCDRFILRDLLMDHDSDAACIKCSGCTRVTINYTNMSNHGPCVDCENCECFSADNNKWKTEVTNKLNAISGGVFTNTALLVGIALGVAGVAVEVGLCTKMIMKGLAAAGASNVPANFPGDLFKLENNDNTTFTNNVGSNARRFFSDLGSRNLNSSNNEASNITDTAYTYSLTQNLVGAFNKAADVARGFLYDGAQNVSEQNPEVIGALLECFEVKDVVDALLKEPTSIDGRNALQISGSDNVSVPGGTFINPTQDAVNIADSGNVVLDGTQAIAPGRHGIFGDNSQISTRNTDIQESGDTALRTIDSDSDNENVHVTRPGGKGRWMTRGRARDLNFRVDEAAEEAFRWEDGEVEGKNLSSSGSGGDAYYMESILDALLTELLAEESQENGLNQLGCMGTNVNDFQGQDIVESLIKEVDCSDTSYSNVSAKNAQRMVDATRANNISGQNLSGSGLESGVRTLDSTGYNSWYDMDYSDLDMDLLQSTNDENFDVDNVRADMVGGDFFDGNGTTRAQISNSSLTNGGGNFIRALDMDQIRSIHNQANDIAATFLEADGVASVISATDFVSSAGGNYARIRDGIELLLRDLTVEGVAGDMINIEQFIELAVERVSGKNIGLNAFVAKDGAQLLLDGLNVAGIVGDGYIIQNVPRAKVTGSSVANAIGAVARFLK